MGGAHFWKDLLLEGILRFKVQCRLDFRIKTA